MRVPNIHFEPESRQLQTARLEHLLSFSDLVVLLIAEQGLGRSHLLSRLAPDQSPMQPTWVQLSLDTAFDVTQLLESLIAQLGQSCEPNNRARLTALHAYSRSLQESDLQLVICIDDADFLSDNALELLINFSRVENAAPRIVLAGLPEFEQRFFNREFNRLVEGSLHIEHLQPYTSEEARAFVDAHLLDGRVLKDSEYRRLLAESHGRPDQLKNALAKRLDSLSREKAPRGNNRWYWGGVSLILGIVSVALGYLYFPNNSGESEVVPPISIAIPNVRTADTQSPTALIEARTELAKRIAEQEAKLSQVAESIDLTEAEQLRAPVNAAVESVASSQVLIPNAETDVAALVSEPSQRLGSSASEQSLAPAQRSSASNNPIGTALSGARLSGAEPPEVDEPAEVVALTQALGQISQVQSETGPVLSQLPPGTPADSSVNTALSSATDSATNSAINSTSANSIRMTDDAPSQSIQAVASATDQSPQVATTAVVPTQSSSLSKPTPTPTVTQSVSGVSDSPFDPQIDQVLSWPASDVTVQLLAARVEASADKLMARHPSVKGILKLDYPFKGATRYTLVLGHFPSRDAATRAVAALPEELQNLKPWIRSVAGLKAELNQAFNP